MDRKYWENIASDYSKEIFDVLENDTRRIIQSAIREFSLPGGTVLDAGCAVGKWLPLLSGSFRKVIAADISSRNLAIAKKNNHSLQNIRYLRSDLSSKRFSVRRCDAVLCVNAILTDSLPKRNTFFHNLYVSLKKDGVLMLAVPSLESWMLTRIVQQRWKIDEKLFAGRLEPATAARRYRELLGGNAEIDNVATKHYLREELLLLLAREHFTVQRIEKIEYEWNSEFLKPPRWLKRPGPWDWFLVARKTGKGG